MTTSEPGAKSVDRVLRELDVRIRARYPLIAINTYEEDRVREALIDLVFQERHKEKPLYFWSRPSGLQKIFDPKEGILQNPASVGDTEDPEGVLGSSRNRRRGSFCCATTLPTSLHTVRKIRYWFVGFERSPGS